MGATDSKLQFKNHVFRLFEEADIPVDDPYWAKFWQQPETASDIFTLLTASDIRQTRDLHIENLETLLLAITSRMFVLYNHSAFPSVEMAPPNEMLNCLRLLTRIMPFIYEKRDHRMEEWEQRFFWGKRRVRNSNTSSEFEEQPPLAERLIDTGLGLLFYSGFTIPKGNSSSKIAYSIWETGVGCSTPMTTSHEMHSNRIEVLRFLLTLCSNCLYDGPNGLATKGSKYLTYTVTREDKRGTMAILCSLLNVTLKYYPGWKVPYDHMIVSDRHRQLVTYSLQYLELLLAYMAPEKRNWFRHYASKIHRIQDLQFIADSLTKLLTQPIQASTSYLPGSRREIEWVCELTMLLWDLIQCNKKFKTYLISSNRIHDFTILLQYYIHDKLQDGGKQGFVRLCAYVLLYLSSDEEYCKSLSKRFEGQSALPQAIKLSVFNGTYSDYLIIQLLKSITNSGDNLDFMVTTLLDVIFNISPYVEHISYLASSNLVHLFHTLSSPSFFLANERNQYILGTLLQVFSLLVNCNFHSNANIIFAMLRNSKSFYALKDAIHKQTSLSEEDLGSSAGKKPSNNKGKGKADASQDTPQLSEQEAAISRLADIWAILDPLIMMIESVKESIQFPDEPHHGNYEPHQVIDKISKLTTVSGVEIQKHEPSYEEFESINFIWNASSLGWYQSVLWGAIYRHEHDMGTTSSSITETGIGNPNMLANVGVWNGTEIKLFKLQEITPSGPTFTRPKGAVDALADTMIQKFGQITTSRD